MERFLVWLNADYFAVPTFQAVYCLRNWKDVHFKALLKELDMHHLTLPLIGIDILYLWIRCFCQQFAVRQVGGNRAFVLVR